MSLDSCIINCSLFYYDSGCMPRLKTTDKIYPWYLDGRKVHIAIPTNISEDKLIEDLLTMKKQGIDGDVDIMINNFKFERLKIIPEGIAKFKGEITFNSDSYKTISFIRNGLHKDSDR